MQTKNQALQEHIALVKRHKALFIRAVSELKYSASDLAKALTAEGIPVSSSHLKAALAHEKVTFTLQPNN